MWRPIKHRSERIAASFVTVAGTSIVLGASDGVNTDSRTAVASTPALVLQAASRGSSVPGFVSGLPPPARRRELSVERRAIVIGATMEHRILLVANQTLGGDELTEAVRNRVAAGATEIWVVAPAVTPPDPLGAAALATGAQRVAAGRGGAELAEQRLRDALYRFRALGITVAGEVSDEDALGAVGEALARREFDEVIISTLPTGVSHWLRTDLPSRVQRRFAGPVTTVTARHR